MGACWSLSRSLSGDFGAHRDGVRWIACPRLRRTTPAHLLTLSSFPASHHTMPPACSLLYPLKCTFMVSHTVVTAWYSCRPPVHSRFSSLSPWALDSSKSCMYLCHRTTCNSTWWLAFFALLRAFFLSLSLLHFQLELGPGHQASC
jgi:hypothetical protein